MTQNITIEIFFKLNFNTYVSFKFDKNDSTEQQVQLYNRLSEANDVITQLKEENEVLQNSKVIFSLVSRMFFIFHFNFLV
jgi:hypothetical protein